MKYVETLDFRPRLMKKTFWGLWGHTHAHTLLHLKRPFHSEKTSLVNLDNGLLAIHCTQNCLLGCQKTCRYFCDVWLQTGLKRISGLLCEMKCHITRSALHKVIIMAVHNLPFHWFMLRETFENFLSVYLPSHNANEPAVLPIHEPRRIILFSFLPSPYTMLT